MQDLAVSFAKEHLVVLVYGALWYILAGVLAAVFGKKSQIDAWCEANPKTAFVVNMLRATGIDVWKIAKQVEIIARSKSGLPPGATVAMLFAGVVALSQPGCSLEAARAARINSQLKASQSAGAPVTAMSRKTCESLDDWKSGVEIVGGVVVAPIGVAAGVVAAADTSTQVQNIAIGTALVAVAVETGALAASGKLGSVWTEKCDQ